MTWSSTVVAVVALVVALASSNSCSYAFAPSSTSFHHLATIATRTTTAPFSSIDINSGRSRTSSSSSSRLFLEPLAEEGEWAAYLDDANTGLVYYFNAGTGESRWEPPTSSFPSVSLDPNQRVAAKSKQEEYKATLVDAAEEKEEQEAKKGGGFSFFGRGKKKVEEVVAEIEEPVVEEEKKGGRFGLGAIFGGRKSNQEADVEDAINGAAAAIAASASKPVAAAEKIIAPEDTSIKIDMSAYVLPHPAKVRWGGEDAVFIRGRSFGVFDGVSGAEKLDGVPLYSVTLAQELKGMIDPKVFLSVQEITRVLTSAAEFADKAATGASTAVVASLSEEGDLNILNVGDCTCAVVRNSAVVARTREIVHYFDCPYQLSEDSPDRPRDGTKLTLKVQKGDVIVMGSDGIFDNLQDAEICDLVSNQKTRASMLARKVVERSRRVSLDETAETPYAKLAKRNGDSDYSSGLGGKVDDVSCIVVKCS